MMDEPADPFHDGEKRVQERAGVREKAARSRAFIRNHMPDQHRDFFAQLPWLLLGGMSDDGELWASVLTGPPGFLSSPDPYSLSVAALPAADDPLAGAIRPGQPLGLLGIEPQTRRRNRLNATITAVTPNSFTLAVDESFGNCPQYITRRQPVAVSRRPQPPVPLGPALNGPALALLGGADTFYIATASANPVGHDRWRGIDLSHRGGEAGFVRTGRGAGGITLTIPDHPGNNQFRTLGNLDVNDHCGLLFLDHAGGGLLHLGGRGRTVWHGDRRRDLVVDILGGLWRPGALPLDWSIV